MTQVILNLILPKLSDLILHAVVAAGFPAERGFSLRCSSLDRAKLSFVGLRKLRNPSIRSGQALKVAATKSLNLGFNKRKTASSIC
jgi:hypothetical protein